MHDVVRSTQYALHDYRSAPCFPVDLTVNTDKRAYRYVIGIDLGTTNTVVAYVDLKKRRRHGRRQIDVFEVPQLVAPGEVDRAPALPSFLYLPGPHDLPAGSTALPWDADRADAVGILAREQGADVPGRLVASAKSWLSHEGVDRTADILPWKAADDVDPVSPVEASRRYLEHVRRAWNHGMANGDAERLEEQLVVLTVPASFDEVARELTVEAARAAGIARLILLEEPLAAFYAWLSDHDEARGQMQDGELVLVCDVGGGTSDFSVVGIRRQDDDMQFERLAVGDHLMLGGDNMDHALGRHVEAELMGAPGTLDVRRWHQLVHQSRHAKEQLLGAQDEAPVTITGVGSSLVGGSRTHRLGRDVVERLVLDGFFPVVGLDAPLQAQRRAGLTELGLPYETDPAITRHLAAFWRRFEPLLRQETERLMPAPDYVLFNGGVFTPTRLRERLLDVVQAWFEVETAELTNTGLDRAVATGAAYYGLVRLGEGTRVGSGSARAYYVGIEMGDEQPDRQGQPAVCLVPRGVEEGFAAHLEAMPVAALTNQPVTFHLFSSTTRTGDDVGDVVTLDPDAIHALPPLRTVLRFGRKGIARKLPVELGVRLTEVGTLELWAQSLETEHRWQLPFDVRQNLVDTAITVADSTDTLDLAHIEAAQAMIESAFEEAHPTDDLWERLADHFNAPPESWPLPVVRKLADTLLGVPRDRNPIHEVRWFDLMGFCLRPGTGDDVDDWRMKEVWKRYMEGLHFATRPDNRLAWWQFWRRVSAGLPAGKQSQIYYDARPFVQLKSRTGKRHRLYPRKLDEDEKLAAWKALATFERLPVDLRTNVAEQALLHLKRSRSRPRTDALRTLARIGARYPVYGPLDALVPAPVIASWLKTLLTLHLPRTEAAAQTLVHLAQQTGGRERDVPDELRQQVQRWLRKMDEPDPYVARLSAEGPDLDWLREEPLPPAGGLIAEPTAIAVSD